MSIKESNRSVIGSRDRGRPIIEHGCGEMQTKGSPEEVGHVRSAIESMGCHIGELGKAVEILRSRLQPVLLDSAPQCGSGEQKGNESTSEVARAIFANNDNLRGLTWQVRDLSERLDV